MKNKPPLIIIGGATGVGKSALSVLLAKKINGEIISADSMQVYRGMDIGTAKITKEDTGGVAHYMIDEVDPDFDFNVFEFKKRAEQYIKNIYEKGRIPILAGGGGFYIQSVLYGIEFSEEPSDNAYRKELEAMGSEELYEMLKEEDSVSAGIIHMNNRKRIIRALEFYHNTGVPISEHNMEQKNSRSPYNYAYFVLNRSRAEIYRRIDLRVDQMMADGLTEEVLGLYNRGINEECLSMQAIGYREMIPYLKGEISIEEAAAKIKLDTRHYAKRQLTWFRREKEAVWMDYGDYEDENAMLSAMIKILKEKQIV